MSYTPTIWANGKAPALNADNLNKIENELVKLDNDVSTLEGELSSLAEKTDITTTTSTTMPNSYSGRLKVDEIVGECQQFTTSGKNLLDCRSLKVGTVNGVTFTPNFDSDGNLLYLEVNGTATAYTEYAIASTDALSGVDTAGCILSGCPNGGAYNTFSLAYLEWGSSWTALFAGYDYGNGTNISRDGNMVNVAVRIIINSGYTATKLRFYPMIRKSSVTDATYEPCTGGIPSPNPSYPQEIKSVKGYKNLLDCRGLAKQTANGVTFTPVYDDGGNLLYIEANGTASGNTSIRLADDFKITGKEDYILSGSPSDNNGGASYRMQMVHHENNAYTTLARDTGNGQTIDTSNYQNGYIEIIVTNGTNVTGVRFHPMIRKASIEDSTYVPYGMWGVKVHGKNMFNGIDQHYYLNGSCTQSGVNQGDTGFVLKVDGGTYTVSTKVVQSRFRVACSNGLVESFGLPFACFNGQNKDGQPTSVTIDCTGYSYLIVNATDLSAIQVEEGSVATAYEPYTESTIALSTDLYGIGDVKDYIDVERGKVVRRFVKYDLSTLVQYFSSNRNGWYAVLNESKPLAKCLFEKYKYSETSWYSDNYAGVDKDKTFWCKNNDSTNKATGCMIVELATPTEEDLPIADQIALNSIKTYDGITYLEFDSEIVPTFKGEYGTSKVGGYTLEGMLASRNGEILAQSNANRITALEATVVNNI